MNFFRHFEDSSQSLTVKRS